MRFREFDELWDHTSLESIGRIIRGSSPRPKGDPRYYGGDVPRLMVQDVTRDGKWVTPSIDFLTEEGAKKSRPCPKGTLTIVCSGTVGIVSFLAKDACIHDGFLAVVDILEKQINKDFLYHQLSTLRETFEQNATHGGVFTNLTTTEVKIFQISKTSLPEQEKIAAFLTSVDNRIEQLKRKKSLLQDYKKGVMQRLFSQQLRFKDNNGNNYPDWEEKKLGDVVEVNPKSPSLPDSFLYIDLESVNDGILSTPSRISKSDAPSRAQRLMQKGDVLYQMVRPYQKNNLKFSLEGTYVASTGFAQLRATTNSSDFIYQLLLTERFTDMVLKRCMGTSYPAINSSDLTDIEIPIPSPIEQNKIANYLSSLDTKIEQITQQITQTQTFKRGLLQQMFV